MNVKTEQVRIENYSELDYDFIIGCSGYEQRAGYLLFTFNCKGTRKYVISFNSHKTYLFRPQNDLLYRQNNYIDVPAEEKNSDGLGIIFDDISAFLDKHDRVLILIDYSSMARVWYAALLLYCNNINSIAKTITVVFSYTKAVFKKPGLQESYNSDIEPLQGYFSIAIPHKPTALIIGLGYIEKQAYGLAEYFDAEPYIFIGKNKDDDGFFDEVISTNKALMADVQSSNIFYYSLGNLGYAESLLDQLCKELQSSYRIVLAPCGPKPFTLISLITALRNKSVDVWRISAKSSEEMINKQASGVIYGIMYTQTS